MHRFTSQSLLTLLPYILTMTTMTWIFFTFLAAFMQAWRNALQSKLNNDMSVAGVYLYGLY
ncbi:multidrug transporter, partial [Pseudoalteromonas sp. S558]